MSGVAPVPPTLDNFRVRDAPDFSQFRLPPRLRRAYAPVQQLRKRGSEALLVQARPADSDGAPVVMKLYCEALSIRNDSLSLIKASPLEHVVQLVDFGTDAGVGYEILEFVAGGDLEDLVARLGGPPAEEVALAAIAEIAEALASFHGLATPAMVHGDIKPTNILVRTTDPLDLVLADFGLATVEHQDRRAGYGTPRWSAPATLQGWFHPQGDWWSLGALAYWLRTGKQLLHEVPRDSSAAQLLAHSNPPLDDLPSTDRHDWGRLCRGLLTRAEAARWGHAQVREWLAGGTPAVSAQWDPPAPPTVVVTAPVAPVRIRFEGQEYADLPSLGVGLAQGWDRTVQLLTQSPHDLLEPLEQHAITTGDLDLAADLWAVVYAYESAELRASRLIGRLSPTCPPVFGEWAVDAAGLAGLADEAAANPSGEAGAALESLFESRSIQGWPEIPSVGAGEDLSRGWDRDYDYWRSAYVRFNSEPDGITRRRALGRLLLARLRPAEQAALTRAAHEAARGPGRRQEWFRALSARETDSPGAAYAVLTLAPIAEAQTRRDETEARAARNARAADRAGYALARIPGTLQALRWALVAQGLMLTGTVALRLLAPNGWGLNPGDTVQWWLELPSWAQRWASILTDPLVVIPLVTASAVLYARGRSRDVRHPWEWRCMGAAIVLTALLVPPAMPFAYAGWVRRLGFHAPPELRRPSALRTVAFAGGFAATLLDVLVLLDVGAPLDALGFDPGFQQWLNETPAWGLVVGWVAVAASLAGGPDPTWFAVAGAALVGAAGPPLIALAAYTYRRRASWQPWALGAPTILGVIALVTGPLAYLPTTAGWAAAAVAGAWLAFITMRRRRAAGRTGP